MNYIEPTRQLPQRAESLRYLEDLFQCWATAIRQGWDAFIVPIGKLFKQIATVVARALKRVWQCLKLPRRRYHVPYRPRRINHKRAMIAQRKLRKYDMTMTTIEQERKPKQRKGFAVLSIEQRRRIAAMGGKRSHELGTAYRFTPEKAREAGRKGGTISRRRSQAQKWADQQEAKEG